VAEGVQLAVEFASGTVRLVRINRPLIADSRHGTQDPRRMRRKVAEEAVLKVE
jgi:hypothetical protein